MSRSEGFHFPAGAVFVWFYGWKLSLLEEGQDITSVRVEWGGCARPAEKPAEGNPGHPGGGGGQGTQQGQEALADVGYEVDYDDDLNDFVSSSTLKYVNK